MNELPINDLLPVNSLEPAKGRLLIAGPFMDDPYFKRTVVLLCAHNKEGSFGFVLNRYVDLPITDVVDDFPAVSARMSIGGPVQNSNLYFLHTQPDIEGSETILKGLYMGGDFEEIKERLITGRLTTQHIRFFVGYSGWGEHQLENEMAQQSWYIAKSRKGLIMDTTEDHLWARVLSEMGGKYATMSHFAEDPSAN